MLLCVLCYVLGRKIFVDLHPFVFKKIYNGPLILYVGSYGGVGGVMTFGSFAIDSNHWYEISNLATLATSSTGCDSVVYFLVVVLKYFFRKKKSKIFVKNQCLAPVGKGEPALRASSITFC